MLPENVKPPEGLFSSNEGNSSDTDEFSALPPILETSAFTELTDTRPIERWSSSLPAVIECISAIQGVERTET